MVKTSVKFIWRVFWIGLLFVVALFACANFGVFGKMPSLLELENPEADLASEIMSADGVTMGKFYSENRSEVKYSDISPNVIHALIATEDQNFYEHSGIDAKAVARAVFKLGTDGGGSPITQQLAKMILRQGRGNIVERILDKMKEWIVAVKLERNFTKEEIITLYLNRAPWVNVYGIRNASLTYFQKEPSDLKIEEAAVLVGMLKGAIYDPVRFQQRAIGRRNTVIDRMVKCKQKYLTEAEGAALKAKPLITNFKTIVEKTGIAPYFRNSLVSYLKQWSKNQINPKTGEPYDLYRDGLKVYTTINSVMQKYAEEATIEHLPGLQKKLNRSLGNRRDKVFKNHENVLLAAMKQSDRWKDMKTDGADEATIKKAFDVPAKMKVFAWSGKNNEVDTIMTPLDSIKYHKLLLQTSFVAMDPKTGEVKAWVGGYDYKRFKYDHVTAMRQVGSVFKPLLYTLAVTDAGYTPETNIPGGSLTLNGKTITGGGGTMAYCLAWSKNAAAWRLMSIIGVKRTLEFAEQCGIATKLPPYPSIALGSAEIPMLEMLQSYTMFPNKGYNTSPVLITRIEDKNGNLIHEFPLAQSKQVIGEADAYTMVKLMQGVIKNGTARSLNSYNIPVEKAGKTGTTNGYTDGWFIGYTPDLLAGTWIGCDDPFIPIYQNNAGGSEMSAPRWGVFMSKVYADKKLDYGAQKVFDAPAELRNDPIFADSRLTNALNSGDIDLSEDMGNGDASDFFGSGDAGSNDFGLEPDTTTDVPVKPKPAPDKKPETNKPTTPANKPADKNEKPKPKPKAVLENEY